MYPQGGVFTAGDGPVGIQLIDGIFIRGVPLNVLNVVDGLQATRVRLMAAERQIDLFRAHG